MESVALSAQSQPMVRDWYSYAPTEKYSDKGLSAITDPNKNIFKHSVALSAISIPKPICID